MLVAVLILACTACSTGETVNIDGTESPSSTNLGATVGDTPDKDTQEVSGVTAKEHETDNVSVQQEPVEANIDRADIKEVARAYREILEATEFPENPFDGGVFIDAVICVKDICGDDIPELLYILKEADDEKRELHIWTYYGEPVEILTETIADSNHQYGAGDYGVMTSNDGSLYIYQSGAGSNREGYRIFFPYTFNTEQQKYIKYALTSSSVIKYIHGFEIFDGYSAKDWDDEEKFNAQREELFSNLQYYLFTGPGYFEGSYPQIEQMYYAGAMEYLDKMESGNID